MSYQLISNQLIRDQIPQVSGFWLLITDHTIHYSLFSPLASHPHFPYTWFIL